MRIIYVGMTGPLSLAPLVALLDAGCPIAAVVTPGPMGMTDMRQLQPPPPVSQLPVATAYMERNIIHLAWEQDIPVFESGAPGAPALQQAWRRLQPDVVFVSCFPHRIPAALLALPRHGFLNLHPSLLPAYRGPFPLFWQLRDGLTEGGVTVHVMSEALDVGDIVLQESLVWPDGLSGAERERLAGERGGALFVEVVRQLEAGALPRRPQPQGGSYQPAPGAADFELDLAWSARRAFNFMRGTAHWGLPYALTVAGRTLQLRRAIDYDVQQRLPAPLVEAPSHVLIQFAQGVLRATPAA
ncbi:MAG TPA: formyltransferase family protein [Candidatus Sulfomarinibacteraceae bacterium]|nr:formyltransferase family protein [Candidatus Sulfomarinibacteraceae bacterium]